jgi:hypothetical protein
MDTYNEALQAAADQRDQYAATLEPLVEGYFDSLAEAAEAESIFSWLDEHALSVEGAEITLAVGGPTVSLLLLDGWGPRLAFSHGSGTHFIPLPARAEIGADRLRDALQELQEV